MRTLLPATLLTLVLMVPGAALADRDHDECDTSIDFIDTPVAHVDLYRHSCFGLAVYFHEFWCETSDLHVTYQSLAVHVPILHEGECETGVLVGSAREGNSPGAGKP